MFLRIKTFLDPKTGDNFQSQKALDAIKQGGLTGQGMGEGILKDEVPEAHTDYIIAVVSEEFGAIFVLFIVTIFLFIGYKVFNKVFSEKNEFLKLALVGLVSLLIIQTFIHIGVNCLLITNMNTWGVNKNHLVVDLSVYGVDAMSSGLWPMRSD